MTTDSAENRPPAFGSGRYKIFLGAVIFAGVVIFARLLFLQIIRGGDWTAQAEENRTRTINEPAPRGLIYDRNGYALAANVPSYNVTITPANLPSDEADIQEIYRQLSELIEVPVNHGTVDDAKNVAACVEGPGIAQLVELGDSNAPYAAVPVKCNVDEDLAMTIRQKAVDWPGVSIQIQPTRDYPTGYLSANLIGFLGPIPENQSQEYEDQGFVVNRDKVGYAGIEASMQDALAGQNGTRDVEVDVAGREIRNLRAPIEPVPGNNVYLTIDARLQAAAEAALVGEINSWNQRYINDGQPPRISSGAAIVMDPKTGEILAMVQWPSFENNRFARIIPAYYYQQVSLDPRHPMLNYAISGEFPPGSVYKLTTATGALNEEVVTLDQVIEAPGEIKLCEQYYVGEPCTDLNQRPFRDWIFDQNPAGFGKVTFLKCIAWSSNVCFYKLGGGYKDEVPEGLGPQRHAEYAKALGYGSATGIELFGEASGLVPTPQWKRINLAENWSTGDTYISSVGQGYVTATPLQVLMSAVTMANSGVQMKPTLIRQIVDSAGNVVKAFTPVKRWDITKDNLIAQYNCDEGFCVPTGEYKNVSPYVVDKVRQGMRLAVTDPEGTLDREISFKDYPIAIAGKTGTAEYCDDVARKQDRCKFGLWPTHAWTTAFAPYDDPEVAIVAFVYNGGEGGVVAAPIVRKIMDAYFKIKAIDAGQDSGGGG
jgi:penicillin-binding protein 2